MEPVEPPGPQRRKYNRRQAPENIPPPYFEVFERIAEALESIDRTLRPDQQDAEQPTRQRPLDA